METSTVTQNKFAVSFLTEEIKKKKSLCMKMRQGKEVLAFLPETMKSIGSKVTGKVWGRDLKVEFSFFFINTTLVERCYNTYLLCLSYLYWKIFYFLPFTWKSY